MTHLRVFAPSRENMPTIPIPNASAPVSYEGLCRRKPWDYQVTAVVPCINLSEPLTLCVELLRLQTVRPYILVIDTGSSCDEFAKIEALRSEDLEVHALRFNGVVHSSDLPAIAMDLAFSACRTPYLFATHQDCFLRRRDVLEYFLREMSDGTAAAGYQLTPRNHSDWRECLGHTAAMFDMRQMDRHGITWSLRRVAHLYDLESWRHDVQHSPCWPDTETCMNTLLRAYKLKRKFLGREENFVRNRDAYIDHVRSMPCAKLYAPEHYQKTLAWYADAKREAEERIAEWRALAEREQLDTLAVSPTLPNLPSFSKELPRHEP